MFDGFSVILNKGKEVVNFFGVDFKIDLSVIFGKMEENFNKNMILIKNGWLKIMSEVNVNIFKDVLDQSIKIE